MTKNKKMLFLLLLLAAIGIVGYILYKRKKATLTNNTATGLQPGKVTQENKAKAEPPATGEASFPLVKGSKGNEVRQLQAVLNKKYNAFLTEDGILGSATVSALDRAGFKLPIDKIYYNIIFAKK